jgi:hypothetical protein
MPMMALEFKLFRTITLCFTVLFITVKGILYTPTILSESLEALEIFTVGGFLTGLFSMGIFLNYLIAITVTSAPVSNNQVEVRPWIVFTVICGRLTQLLSRLANDVFSAIFHLHILTRPALDQFHDSSKVCKVYRVLLGSVLFIFIDEFVVKDIYK